jgi:hypothetical protein
MKVQMVKRNLFLNVIPCDGKIKNRNGRIYDESEVLKHLAYLHEKIKNEECIIGELDHPECR